MTEEQTATFRELGLSEELLEALDEKGYRAPTEIQRRAIPPVMAGRDVLGSAQTGTGKTAAFILPTIQRLAGRTERRPGAVVVTPTRELAQQIEKATAGYGRLTSIEPVLVHGGTPLDPETEALRFGCDVLVATPGRLLDHVRRGNADLSRTEVLILDEADRMLDMGFIDDVRKIAAETPEERQTLLFSATMPNAIKSLAHELMDDPVMVEVGLETAADGIDQVVHPVDPQKKHQLLLHLIREETEGQILVFTRTRNTTSYLADFLRGRDVSSDDLHGGKSQDQRTRSLERFRQGETRVLVATNVAARGLDIRGIRHVVNYDVPRDPRDYVHRVGRTARAEDTGDAVTLMSPHEWLMVRDIERLMGTGIGRRTVEGFAPRVEPLESKVGTGDEDESRPEPSALTRGRRRR